MKITTNSTTYSVATTNEGYEINGLLLNADIVKIDQFTFHVIAQHRSFVAEVVEFDKMEKRCVLKINGTMYPLTITDRYSELLLKMGLDAGTTKKVTELKAPMPGMVLNIFVSEGETIEKNASLITLEAMKMENILKSPVSGTIKSIKAIVGNKVEKNQVLISFEL